MAIPENTLAYARRSGVRGWGTAWVGGMFALGCWWGMGVTAGVSVWGYGMVSPYLDAMDTFLASTWIEAPVHALIGGVLVMVAVRAWARPVEVSWRNLATATGVGLAFGLGYVAWLAATGWWMPFVTLLGSAANPLPANVPHGAWGWVLRGYQWVGPVGCGVVLRWVVGRR